MLLVGAAVAGIAHHLHGARNLREGRAVVLSGDEWDGRSVFKGTIFRCFASTELSLNLLAWLWQILFLGSKCIHLPF
jgi:hypothetical protein